MSSQPQSLTDLADPDDLIWLDQMCDLNRYCAPQIMPGGRWAAISPFIFTTAILVGELRDDWSFTDRWCFNDFALALRSLAEWRDRDFEGEPIGWHRHPMSGRRRPEGDAAREYVNP